MFIAFLILRCHTAAAHASTAKQNMRYLPSVLPFITGLILGFAQCTSRLLLIRKSLAEGLLFGGITATLYLLAIIQWAKVLKSPENLSSSYALVVLGVFMGLFIMNLLRVQGETDVSIQDIIGIILIAIGSALIKY